MRQSGLKGIKATDSWCAVIAPLWKDVTKILVAAGAPKEWGAIEAVVIMHAALDPAMQDEIGLTERPAQTLRELKAHIGSPVELTGEMFRGLWFVHLLAEAPDTVIDALPKLRKMFKRAVGLAGKSESGLPSPELIATQYILALNNATNPQTHDQILKGVKALFPEIPFSRKVIENASRRVRDIHSIPPK